MGGFLQSTTITLAARLAGALVGSLNAVLIARLLGPEQQGRFASAWLLPTLACAFFGLGYNNATVRLVGARQFPAKVALGQNLFFAAASSVFALAVSGLLLARFGSALFPNTGRAALLWALAALPALLSTDLFAHFLLGVGRIARFNVAGNLGALGISALLLPACALSRGSLSVETVLSLHLVASAAATVVALRWCFSASEDVSLSVDWGYQRAAMKFGLIVYLANLITVVDCRVGMLIANVYLSPAELGHYSVAVRLAEGIWLVSLAMSVVLFPMSAASTSDGEAVGLCCQVSRACFLLTLAAVAALWALAPSITVLLFSRAYLPVVGPLRILLLGTSAISVWRIMASDLTARGRPSAVTAVCALSMAGNVAGSLLLVRRYGMTGVAWAVTASYWARLAATMTLYCQGNAVAWTDLWLPKAGDFRLYRRAARRMIDGLAAYASSRRHDGQGPSEERV